MATQVIAKEGYSQGISSWSTPVRTVVQDYVREAGFFSKAGNFVWRKSIELGVFIPAGKPSIMDCKALSIREKTLLHYGYLVQQI